MTGSTPANTSAILHETMRAWPVCERCQLPSTKRPAFTPFNFSPRRPTDCLLERAWLCPIITASFEAKCAKHNPIMATSYLAGCVHPASSDANCRCALPTAAETDCCHWQRTAAACVIGNLCTVHRRILSTLSLCHEIFRWTMKISLLEAIKLTRAREAARNIRKNHAGSQPGLLSFQFKVREKKVGLKIQLITMQLFGNNPVSQNLVHVQLIRRQREPKDFPITVPLASDACKHLHIKIAMNDAACDTMCVRMRCAKTSSQCMRTHTCYSFAVDRSKRAIVCGTL